MRAACIPIGLIAVALSMAAACRERGHVSFVFEWTEGASAGDRELYAFLRIEERATPWISENRVLSTSGPVRLGRSGEFGARAPDIPNGDNRVAILEIRSSISLDAPIEFFGLSEPFSIGPNVDVEVPILVQPTPAPRAPADGRGVRIESHAASGFVSGPRVVLQLITDRGKTARISNDRAFTEDRTRIVTLSETETATAAGAPPSFSAFRAPWELEPCAGEGVCLREVFVRFQDQYGYESVVMSDRVWLDVEAPSLRSETALEPPAAGPTTRVKLSLVASEVLRRAPEIAARGAPEIRFARILPPGEEPSSTYVYLSEPLGEARPDDGAYMLETTLEDLAGNVSPPRDIGALVLDGVAPSIGSLTARPERVGPRDEVRIGFVLGEDLAEADLRVTLGGIDVRACARSGAAPQLRVECVYRMSGTEIPDGTQKSIAVIVWASDAALNRSAIEVPLFADFAAPLVRDVDIYPAHARAGSSATLRVAVTEGLRQAPAITWRGGQDPGFVWSPDLSSDFEYFFVLPVGASSTPGVFELEQVELTDVVGNREVYTLTGATFAIDLSPPLISELTVSPPLVGLAPGAVVSVDMTVDEAAPLGAPRVTLGAEDLTPSCALVEDVPPRARWRCLHRVHGAEIPAGTESELAVVVEAQDEAGNLGRAIASAAFDFLAPTLRSVSFEPEAARAGDVARLRLTASEPLDPAFVPALSFSGGALGFLHLSGGTIAEEHTFELAVTPALASGRYTLTAVSVRDLAGNEANVSSIPGVLPATWLVDQVAPEIVDMTVTIAGGAAAVMPRVPLDPGRVLEISFREIEAHPAGVRVTLGSIDLTPSCAIVSGATPDRSWRCRYTTSGNECPPNTEATESAVVQIFDAAGNTETANAPVVFDYSPPALHAVAFTPAAAGAGDDVQLYLAATEALDPSFVPVLTWSEAPPPFVHRSSGATDFERYFDLVVSPALGSGTFTLAGVTLRDVAGNETTAAPGPAATWLIDQVDPQISNLVVRVAGGAAVTPPRVPLGAGRVIEATFTEDEAHPASLRASLGGRDLTSSCAVTGGAPPSRTWRCAYTTSGAEYATGVEATESFVVEVTDQSGNRRSASAGVVFDFAPPALTSVSITPSPAGIGSTAVLTISASEALEAGFVPALTWSRAITFVHQPALSTPHQRIFQYSVPAGATISRTYSLNGVSLRDVAGNNATITAAPLPIAWLLDNIAPVIGPVTIDVGSAALGLPATSPPRINRAAGRNLIVSFTVTETNPDSAGPRVLAGALDISGACVPSGSGGTRTWTCTHAMSASDSPGLHTIDVRVRDTAGNGAGDSSATVVFDFDPPELIAGSASIDLIPGPGNPLASVARATRGSTVELRFELDETLAEAPLVSPVSGALTFAHQPRPGNVFLYTHTVGAAASCDPSCTYSFTIDARDQAGNSASLPLEGLSLTLDTRNPGAPAVGVPNRIVLDRRPWGDSADPDPRLILSGGAGAVEAGAVVIVSSRFDTGAEITRIRAAGDGSIPATVLNTPDMPTVGLEAVDDAGNRSGVVEVRDGVWLATLNGKTPGTVYPNPHRLLVTPAIQETVEQSPSGGGEREASEAELAAAIAPDAQRITVAALPSWQSFIPSGEQPIARRDHGLAYDSGRGRAVLFGGVDAAGATLDETWEHDGESWHRMNPVGAWPTARSKPMMIYDAARERVMLIGGVFGTSGFNDVWSYDGTSWTQLASSAPFPARRGGALGYHAELGVVVLFGGHDGARARSDTWVWDGVSWTSPVTLSPPPAREDAAFAYLPPAAGRAGTLVLFGGRNGASARLDDTWTWANGWSEQLPATRPSARARAAMAIDPNSDPSNVIIPSPRVVLFGGDTAGGASSEVWNWDGTSWVRPAATGYAAPSARVTPWVYDARHDRFVFFGGASGSAVLGETWAWNRSRWTNLTTTSSERPPARRDHAFAATAERAMVFGGQEADATPWMLDANGWHPWSTSGTGPGARTGPGLAGIDAAFGGGFVLFGGRQPDSSDPPFDETWTWAPSFFGSGWTHHNTLTTRPAARYEHAMARIDRSGSNEVLMFGGITRAGSEQFSNETWIWNADSQTWSQRLRGSCPQWPSARARVAMAYDARRDRVLMFGGTTGTPLVPGVSGELWEWVRGGTCWAQVPPTSCWTSDGRSGAWPSARKDAVMFYDPERGRTMLFGGSLVDADADPTEFGDLWAFEGGAIPCSEVTPQPSRSRPRWGGAAAFDNTRSRVVVFGGRDHGITSDDAFVLSSGLNHRPGARMSIEWGASLIDSSAVQGVTISAVAGGRGYWAAAGVHHYGAMIRVWDALAGRWVTVQTNTGSLIAPAPLAFTTADPASARRLVSPGSERIEAQVTSWYVDYGGELAKVVLDQLEVRVAYRLP